MLRALRVAAVNLAALLLAILALEGGTRLLGIHFPAIERPGVSDRGLWVYDASKGWFHAPGATGQSYRGGPDRGLVRINSLGLRGREVALRKEEGVFRVLVFGDSFAFGVGVDEEHLFSSHLERLLSLSSGARSEVINMGVSGYSTDQELLLFEDLGANLAPDLVLVVACDNDFPGNLSDFAYQAYYKPYFSLEAGGLLRRNIPVPRLSRLQEIKLWLGRESNAWNAFRSRRAPAGPLQAFLDRFQVALPRSSPADPVRLMAAILRAFRARVEASGAAFVVLNTGHRGEKTPLFQALRAELDPEHFHLLGMEGHMAQARRRSPEGHWGFEDDSHWNVDSHRLAAVVAHLDLQRSHLLRAK